jgi:hypothetical protein
MKKYKLLILILLTFISSVKSQEKDNTIMSKICFLRSTGIRAGAVSLKTFIDGNLTCKLSNNRYSIHEVQVGKHDVFFQLRGLKLLKETQKLEIQVEEGKITYVQFFLDDEFLSFKFYAKEISEENAKDSMTKLKEDAKCL